MSKYVVKRVLLMIPTIIGAGILVFLMMRLLPGDICLIRIAGDGMGVSEAALSRCLPGDVRARQSALWAQFFDFVGRLRDLRLREVDVDHQSDHPRDRP